MTSPFPTQITVSDAFAELDQTSNDQPLAAVLKRTAELAKAVLGIAVEASVTLIDADEATTPVFTAKVALELDETQYVLGYGPCLAAAEAGHLISIADIATETRWPQFTQAAGERDVRSTLSIPLPVQRQMLGALNMYSTTTPQHSQRSSAPMQPRRSPTLICICRLLSSRSRWQRQSRHALPLSRPKGF
jgi:GAF domain-containing protein